MDLKILKGALGRHRKLPSKYSVEELQKAYADRMINGGERKLVRGFKNYVSYIYLLNNC